MIDKKKKESLDSIAYRVLLEPWITEEATRTAELNKYIFKVCKGAKKSQIKKSLEDTYKVDVISVNTISIPRKKRLRGKITGWKSGFKKAVVTVKEGQKIDIFEGK
jgi:large subunit ribosomal protein L23